MMGDEEYQALLERLAKGFAEVRAMAEENGKAIEAMRFEPVRISEHVGRSVELCRQVREGWKRHAERMAKIERRA